MNRTEIKTLVTRMLQNRSAIPAAYIDQILDTVYGHTLVDAVPSFGRRGIELLVTAVGTPTYTLSDEWRALDADYAYLDDGTRLPIYTSQEQWLRQVEPPADAPPSRLLLFYDDPSWVVEVAPEPASIVNINIPGTFYRGVLPDAGTPNHNESLALVYGTTLHLALMSGLDEIVAAAQSGFNTQLGLLRSQYASERNTPTSLPPRRDF